MKKYSVLIVVVYLCTTALAFAGNNGKNHQWLKGLSEQDHIGKYVRGMRHGHGEPTEPLEGCYAVRGSVATQGSTLTTQVGGVALVLTPTDRKWSWGYSKKMTFKGHIAGTITAQLLPEKEIKALVNQYLHGTIQSIDKEITQLNHSIVQGNIQAAMEDGRLTSRLQSHGDVFTLEDVIASPDGDLLFVGTEIVKFVFGTGIFANLDAANSKIVAYGTLNTVTGQNSFTVDEDLSELCFNAIP